MSPSKEIDLLRDLAAHVHQSLYSGDTVSHVGTFDPASSFVKCCPSNFLSGSTSSFLVWIISCIRKQYVVLLAIIFCRSLKMTTFCCGCLYISKSMVGSLWAHSIDAPIQECAIFLPCSLGSFHGVLSVVNRWRKVFTPLRHGENIFACLQNCTAV